MQRGSRRSEMSAEGEEAEQTECEVDEMKSQNMFSKIDSIFGPVATWCASSIFPTSFFRRSVPNHGGKWFYLLKRSLDTRDHAPARFISELYFRDYLFSETVHFSRFKFCLSSPFGAGEYECFKQSHLSRACFNYICTLQLHRLSVNCHRCFFRAIGRAMYLFAGAENATLPLHAPGSFVFSRRFQRTRQRLPVFPSDATAACLQTHRKGLLHTP